MTNDRAANIVLEDDVRIVLEFMQQKISAAKLVGVAEALPQLARLLWGQFQQEPFHAIRLTVTKQHPSQSNASECVLAPPCVDDGSVGEAGVQ